MAGAARVVVVHWHAAEAEERAERVRSAGYAAEAYAAQSIERMRALRAQPPDAIVIDLARLPSQGRAMGVWLRQQKATRRVPLVFVGGDPEKAQAARDLIPDAVYCEWGQIKAALRQAMRHPPQAPAVPGTMDSYSGTPLVRKLGIRAGATVVVHGAPSGFEQVLGALPAGVVLRRRARGAAVGLLFVRSRADLARRFGSATGALAEGGRLWICWPKQASGVPTDLTQNSVRAFGLAAGFVDFKVSAINATWAGLCFVRRRARRER